MRIGIDIRKLDDFGIGTYIRNLLVHIAKKDTQNSYILFYPPYHKPFNLPGQNFSKVIEQAGKYSLRELIHLPFQMQRYKLDLFHAPHYTLPPLRPCRAIVTIHDLIHLRFPQYLPSSGAYYYVKLMLFLAARTAEKIITVSQSSKKDIVDILKVSPDKVEVIYNGLGSDFKPVKKTTETQQVLDKFGITRPYILYVGSFRTHKNLKTLLEAYALLKTQQGFEYQMVLVGDGGKSKTELQRLIMTRGWQNKVIITEFIPSDTLSIFYSSADVFVFPSLYEGFGLPPLEAMACGAPVIVSNRSSLPEIVGKAGVLVDPESPQQMAESMRNVLSDKNLQATLTKRGLEQAQRFSWEKAAQKTLEVYHSA
jgi:glycosyltransferase involved in cell wall biosynthesis